MLEQPAQQQFAAPTPPVVSEQKDSFGSLYPLLMLGIVFIVAGLLFPLCIILGVIILILWLIIGVLS
jgi:predicted lipid-binding transport protein (Tim44 family)